MRFDVEKGNDVSAGRLMASRFVRLRGYIAVAVRKIVVAVRKIAAAASKNVAAGKKDDSGAGEAPVRGNAAGCASGLNVSVGFNILCIAFQSSE
ncbi:hypothetical protein [Dickeya solani]|uniref:Uncharacterized protein n=1 Tax=Dickeya solani TaxID=1089444 RepID=A0AAX4ETN9_9GAMM|nr:hypothetical protein [Dickeya solani]WOA50829.1 hypothetical protein RXA29_12775 [Dickeya solani]